MKVLIPIFVFSIASLFPQDSPKLKGVYRVVFDTKYAQQGYQITLSDSNYVKKMPDAITYRGKIKYEKYKATLRKDQEEDPIEIDTREFTKDTIAFSTRSKRDLSKVVNRGKLIKLK